MDAIHDNALGNTPKPYKSQETAPLVSVGLDGLEIGHDSDLVLNADQIQQILQYRESLRSCKSDTEMFQVCKDTRDSLLSQQTRFEYFFARIEAIMATECTEYKRRKRAGWPNNTKAASDWERFVGVATNGAETISKRLPCLRKVSGFWGKEKVQHYEWAYAGEKYCKVLSTAASQVPDWDEALIKLNQLMLRRVTIGKRQPLRQSINPVNQIDLEDLKKWQDKEPYVKMNDRTNLSLTFQALTESDLPNELGFDKYGLIVQRNYATTIGARTTSLAVEEELYKALSETPLSSFFPLSLPGNQQNKLENPTSSESVHLEEGYPIYSRSSTVADIPQDQNGIHLLPAPSATFLEEILPQGLEVHRELSVVVTEMETEKLPTQAPTQSDDIESAVRRGCLSTLPHSILELLELLDSTESLPQNPGIEVTRQLSPFQDALCYRHVRKFTHLASAIALSRLMEGR